MLYLRDPNCPFEISNYRPEDKSMGKKKKREKFWSHYLMKAPVN